MFKNKSRIENNQQVFSSLQYNSKSNKRAAFACTHISPKEDNFFLFKFFVAESELSFPFWLFFYWNVAYTFEKKRSTNKTVYNNTLEELNKLQMSLNTHSCIEKKSNNN